MGASLYQQTLKHCGKSIQSQAACTVAFIIAHNIYLGLGAGMVRQPKKLRTLHLVLDHSVMTTSVISGN